MLYFTWPYCKQLASNVKLATGKYKIISRQLGSFEVLFSRPAEVSVAMGEWATVNFCPCIPILYWNSRWFVIFRFPCTVQLVFNGHLCDKGKLMTTFKRKVTAYLRPIDLNY